MLDIDECWTLMSVGYSLYSLVLDIDECRTWMCIKF